MMAKKDDTSLADALFPNIPNLNKDWTTTDKKAADFT